ncbi:hypothetical protein [Desertihabitans aurantiacus]|nr:hypothetical protein [Desertihabitans aurantiacus]
MFRCDDATGRPGCTVPARRADTVLVVAALLGAGMALPPRRTADRTGH